MFDFALKSVQSIILEELRKPKINLSIKAVNSMLKKMPQVLFDNLSNFQKPSQKHLKFYQIFYIHSKYLIKNRLI